MVKNMYGMLNQNNPVVQQMIQGEKEAYIANKITSILISENLTKAESERVIKNVMGRV